MMQVLMVTGLSSNSVASNTTVSCRTFSLQGLNGLAALSFDGKSVMDGKRAAVMLGLQS